MGTVVKTTAMCFVGGTRYRPGDIFELPEGMKVASWMNVQGSAEKPKVAAKKKATKSENKEPETFSELTKRDAEGFDIDGAHDLI